MIAGELGDVGPKDGPARLVVERPVQKRPNCAKLALSVIGTPLNRVVTFQRRLPNATLKI